MSEHYHALVWIDHHEAKIFQFNATDVDATRVRSDHPHQHIHHKANTRGSGHAPVDEDFLERVTQAVMGAGAILITLGLFTRPMALILVLEFLVIAKTHLVGGGWGAGGVGGGKPPTVLTFYD